MLLRHAFELCLNHIPRDLTLLVVYSLVTTSSVNAIPHLEMIMYSAQNRAIADWVISDFCISRLPFVPRYNHPGDNHIYFPCVGDKNHS